MTAALPNRSKVNDVIDRWTESKIDAKLRKTTLALELARLDALQSVFYEKAVEGDAQSGMLCAKLIGRRCVDEMGLRAPQRAVFEVVDQAAPRESSSKVEM
jgi:hypothetical protein